MHYYIIYHSCVQEDEIVQLIWQWNIITCIRLIIHFLSVTLYLLPGHSFQDPSELLQFVAKETSDLGKTKYVCTLCNKFSHLYRTNVRNHVESKHFPNVFSYECEHCGESFSSKSIVQQHRHKMHKPKSQDYLM